MTKDYIRIVRYGKPQFTPINKLTEFDRGWISGLTDGDGSIHFGQYLETWELWLAVTNTDLPMLNRLKDIVGQGFIVLKAEATDKTKACYEYRLKAKQALGELLPELKLFDKDEQRKLVIQALHIMKELEVFPEDKERMQPKLDALCAEVIQLNARGPTQ